MAARHASGRLLDPSGNGRARQMTVHDRTRLTVLPAYKKNNESRTLLTKELGARIVSNILFTRSNEPRSVLARDLGDCRDNMRNSRSEFLIVHRKIYHQNREGK